VAFPDDQYLKAFQGPRSGSPWSATANMRFWKGFHRDCERGPIFWGELTRGYDSFPNALFISRYRVHREVTS
jgi:hypothetical protein